MVDAVGVHKAMKQTWNTGISDGSLLKIPVPQNRSSKHAGMAISLPNVMAYALPLVKTFLKSFLVMTMPITNMEQGPTMPPRFSIAVSSTSGSLILRDVRKSPAIIASTFGLSMVFLK